MRTWKRSLLWDVSVLLTAAVLMGCYSYFVSRSRILWSDELFAWSLVTDPSLTHMWRAWNLGADSGGPGFYMLCHLWLQVFRRTELAFRAFSAAGIYVALCAAWFMLRRYYRPSIAAVTLMVVYFGSPMILWHLVQTRFYGLLLAAAGWSFYAMLRSAEECGAGAGERRSTLLLAFSANLVLVSTHAFGLFYSGLLLAAAVLVDLLEVRRRWAYYGAVVASWPLLLVSLTALHNLGRVGKPWFWTLRPHRSDLDFAYEPRLLLVVRDRYLAVLLTLLLAVLLWHARAVWQGMRRRRTVLVLPWC